MLENIGIMEIIIIILAIGLLAIPFVGIALLIKLWNRKP